jgi:hypothetical protein
MAKFTGLGYKPRLSHAFICTFFTCFALEVSLWTWPMYAAYAARVKYVSQFWWGSPVDDSQYGPRNQSDTREWSDNPSRAYGQKHHRCQLTNLTRGGE